MYGAELRTYGLGAVVSVLLGAGTGFGWYYFADNTVGKAAAASATPLAQQDAPNPPPSANLPPPREVAVPDGPRLPDLSHARHNPRKMCTKGHGCRKYQPNR